VVKKVVKCGCQPIISQLHNLSKVFIHRIHIPVWHLTLLWTVRWGCSILASQLMNLEETPHKRKRLASGVHWSFHGGWVKKSHVLKKMGICKYRILKYDFRHFKSGSPCTGMKNPMQVQRFWTTEQQWKCVRLSRRKEVFCLGVHQLVEASFGC